MTICMKPCDSFPGSSAGKESACKVGDLGSIPGLGRSSGERKGYPLQYSGLENSMDCIVHGVAELETTEHFELHFLSLLTVKQADLGVPLTSFVSVLPCSPPHFPTPALTPYHSCAPQLAQLSKHLSWYQLGCISCQTVRTIFEVRGQQMKEEPPAHTTFQSRSALPFHFTLLVAQSYPTRRRQWHPTSVLLPAKSHGWRNLVGCSPWGR